MIFRKQESPRTQEYIYWEGKCKTLELNIEKLQQQVKQLEALVDTFRTDARKNMSELQRVAQTICDIEFAQKQLGGSNGLFSMSSFELANFIIENWQKQRSEAIQLIIDLQKALQKKNAEAEDLENQLARILTEQREEAWKNQQFDQENARHSDDNPMEDAASPTVESSEKNLNSREESDIKEAKPEPQKLPDKTVPTSSVSSPQTHLILLEDIENQLTSLAWNILEAIGRKGLSESKEILQYLQQSDESLSQYQFSNALNALKNHLLIGEDKVNTGYRWFYAYHLTDLGLQIYKKHFKESAVLCEKHALQKEHATWEHGYTIKDTAMLMEEMGYQNITYSRKDNEMELANGKTWIPDITAYDPLANKKVYVEVELGHHTQEEFNEKMDKALQCVNEVRFVTNGKQSMEVIIQQFSRWKLEKMKKGSHIRNFDVHITTTKKLSEKDWGNYYPS